MSHNLEGTVVPAPPLCRTPCAIFLESSLFLPQNVVQMQCGALRSALVFRGWKLPRVEEFIKQLDLPEDERHSNN